MNKKKQVFSNGKDFLANLNEYTLNIVEHVLDLDKNNIVDRIWKKDHTVWAEKPDEISNRLGWLKSPEVMKNAVLEIKSFVDEMRESKYNKAILLGMGGSSLAPEVFRYTFGVAVGFLDLTVLDSTDPGAVLEIEKSLQVTKTLFIVSTKSGGTVETISLMKYFYSLVSKQIGEEETGKHFVAITDPGSGLEEQAKNLGFRKIFLNDPNIGGRYSALSYFGLVPAALLGIDILKLIENANKMINHSREVALLETGQNSAAWLGAIMGGLALDGIDKLTFISSPSIKHFGTWIEQLVAESTGKLGKGILPVDGTRPKKAENYSDDRVFIYLKVKGEDDYDKATDRLENAGYPVVRITLEDIYDLGGEIFRWEMATIIAGHILNINPFDQPDVESAKIRAREMVAKFQETGKLPVLPITLESEGLKIYSSDQSYTLENLLSIFFDPLISTEDINQAKRYLAIQAFLKPAKQIHSLLDRLRLKIQIQYGVAVTIGFGPRFLHSTGQLHKGDNGQGLFLQLLADMPEDCAIPDDPKKEGSSISFGILKTSQALGDRQALIDAGRNVMTIDLGSDINKGIKKLIELIG
jgi:glucose-6-phosphate isomerase